MCEVGERTKQIEVQPLEDDDREVVTETLAPAAHGFAGPA